MDAGVASTPTTARKEAEGGDTREAASAGDGSGGREEGYCCRDWTQHAHRCHVQVLRSAGKWSMGLPTETSIYHAYVYAILNAQHSVYIENQYFLSSLGWSQDEIASLEAAAGVVVNHGAADGPAELSSGPTGAKAPAPPAAAAGAGDGVPTLAWQPRLHPMTSTASAGGGGLTTAQAPGAASRTLAPTSRWHALRTRVPHLAPMHAPGAITALRTRLRVTASRDEFASRDGAFASTEAGHGRSQGLGRGAADGESATTPLALALRQHARHLPTPRHADAPSSRRGIRAPWTFVAQHIISHRPTLSAGADAAPPQPLPQPPAVPPAPVSLPPPPPPPPPPKELRDCLLRGATERVPWQQVVEGWEPSSKSIAEAIFLRVAAAIEAGETFRVMVVIPVHPDGPIRTLRATQLVLHWQCATISQGGWSLLERLRRRFPALTESDLADRICFYTLRTWDRMASGDAVTEQVYVHRCGSGGVREAQCSPSHHTPPPPSHAAAS